MFVAVTSEPKALAPPLLICIVMVFPSPETPSLLLSLCLSPDAYDGAESSAPVTNMDAAKMAIIPKVVFELIILYYAVTFPYI